jgi:hypothetical protein
MKFAERHHISADWLLCGDLKGLLRTVRARPQQTSCSAGADRQGAAIDSGLPPRETVEAVAIR